MALLVPPPAFAYCTTNLSGTPSASGANGTTITSGTSNGVGSTTAVISAITHDVEFLQILVAGTQTSTAVNRAMIDVYTDPAGGTSWGSSPIIPNLICGGAAAVSAGVPYAHRFYFPIWIKAGSSIGISVRYAHTVAVTTRILMAAWGGHSQPSQWWCGQKVYDIGATSASTSGVSHTAGASGAYSTWADFGSTTTANAGAVVWGIQPQLSTLNSLGYFFEFGVGGARIGPPLHVSTNTVEAMAEYSDNRLNFSSIPAGTQFQVRGTCTTTAQAQDVAAYIIS